MLCLFDRDTVELRGVKDPCSQESLFHIQWTISDTYKICGAIIIIHMHHWVARAARIVQVLHER